MCSTWYVLVNSFPNEWTVWAGKEGNIGWSWDDEPSLGFKRNI
jgi:hypothetical protein